MNTNEDRTFIALKIGFCPKCNKNPAEEDHQCPYAADIHNDPDFTCNCCGVCEGNCADDI